MNKNNSTDVHDFKKQKVIPRTDYLDKLPIVNYKDVEDINNDKYNWVQVGTSKYGRYMYCINTGIKRTQTIGEFYETRTVD